MDSLDIQLDYELLVEDGFDAINIETDKRTLQLKRDAELLKEKYPAKAHARKVAAELGVREGLIYLPGQVGKTWEDSDQEQTFRQRRYFFYITGVNFPNAAVTYDIGKDHLILWVPFIEPRQVLWFGKSPSTAQAMRRYDVDDARYVNQLPEFLAKNVTASTTLYVLHPDQQPPSLYATSSSSQINSKDLMPAMDRARVIKDNYEIALCRRANDIGSFAHRKVAQSLLRMKNEQQIAGLFLGVCASQNARMPYAIIAGSGINGSTLHYGSNNEPLDGRVGVVLDAGAEVNCYASDITRTLPISGTWPERSEAISRIVYRMQDECIAGVRPGKLFRELHVHAAQVGLEGLHALNILQGDIEEIAEAGTVLGFFPHGLGHHIGLETHDVPGTLPLSVERHLGLENGKRELITEAKLKAMRTATSTQRARLRPGMIVTVEPGLYFCREYLEGYYKDDPVHSKFINWKLLEDYYEVGGVRYEDCILVTEDGYENLTTAPKKDELLKLINGN
ncbi:hypothetical protein Golomagni_05752 [Golovinomyces magnicellulatus]|nr:hypothetical protein Golomagni_05752 [Golovinomyces magnicellulatus]